jgi:hypothetical protein
MALMFFPFPSWKYSSNSLLSSLKAIVQVVLLQIKFSTFSIAFSGRLPKKTHQYYKAHYLFYFTFYDNINCYNSYIYNLYRFNKWNY